MKRGIKPTPMHLAREFKGDLTVIGMAREYGLIHPAVEAKFRVVAKRKAG